MQRRSSDPHLPFSLGVGFGKHCITGMNRGRYDGRPQETVLLIFQQVNFLSLGVLTLLLKFSLSVGSGSLFAFNRLRKERKLTRSRLVELTGTSQLDVYCSLPVWADLGETKRSSFASCCKVTLSRATSLSAKRRPTVLLRSRSSIMSRRSPTITLRICLSPLVRLRPKSPMAMTFHPC